VLGLAVSARADCVAAGAQGQKEIGNYAAGVDLVSATSYVPAGALSEFGLRTPYDPTILYSGKIESDFNALNVGKAFSPIEKHSLNISRIPDDHPLVKRGRMDKNDALVTVEIPSEISGLWEQAIIYIYACPAIDGGSPTAVSSTVVRVSPTFTSIVIAVLFVLLAYVLCALTAKVIDRSNVLNHRWMRYLARPIRESAVFWSD
jgi:hypothetical protein